MKLARHLLWSLVILMASSSTAQPPIQWQRPLGGSGIDCSYSILQTPDGGYIVAGHSESNDGDAAYTRGQMDYWVVKLNAFGILEWERSYGGSDKDEAQCIIPTLDNGYAIAGYSESSDQQVVGNHSPGSNLPDIWIVKIDSKGALQWAKSVGGSDRDEGYAICQAPDSGFVVTGYTLSRDGDVAINRGGEDIWVLKLDVNGDLLWEHTFGSPGEDEGYDIKPTPDSGFVVAGYTNTNAWLSKLDRQGNIVWQREYGGSLFEYFYSVDLTSDGGYICVGGSTSVDGDLIDCASIGGSFDIWIVKLAPDGTILWSKTFGGLDLDAGYCVKQTTDGKYLVSGETASSDRDVTGFHGVRDAWILLLSQQGNLEWQRAAGGGPTDEAYDIVESTDGGYVFTGSTLSNDGDVSGQHGEWISDFWVVKLAPPPTQPQAIGFTSTPVTLSCMSSTDTVKVAFSSSGSYTITTVTITGKDIANFSHAHSTPRSVTVIDSLLYPIPITFTPASGSAQISYEAVVNITIRHEQTSILYTLSIPVSAFAYDALAISIDPVFSLPRAVAGATVDVQFDLSFDKHGAPYTLEQLSIRKIELAYQYNTDLLHLRSDELASRVKGLPIGWLVDMTASHIDEPARTLRLTLTGSTPLPDTISTLCFVEFSVMLPKLDSITGFTHLASRFTNAAGQPLVQPCAAVTAADATFDLQVQCSDRILRSFMQDSTYFPMTIRSVSPNPVKGTELRFIYTLERMGCVTLTIVDARGEVVKKEPLGILKAGSHQTILDSATLPSGVYVYRFDMEGFGQAGRFIIHR